MKLLLSRQLLIRYSWFIAVGAFFLQHDVCIGGDDDDPSPKYKDASPDARLDVTIIATDVAT